MKKEETSEWSQEDVRRSRPGDTISRFVDQEFTLHSRPLLTTEG